MNEELLRDFKSRKLFAEEREKFYLSVGNAEGARYFNGQHLAYDTAIFLLMKHT